MDEALVYPEIWAEEGVRGFEEYLLPHFESLQVFIARAAGAGQPVLVLFT